MNEDIEYAQACWNSYFDMGYFDVIFDGINDDNVWCGLKYNDDKAIVTFRGSTTICDWFRDFDALLFDDPDLGPVERGFMAGLRTTYAQLTKEARAHGQPKQIIVTGHSLGAARALLFGALLTVYNIPCTIVTFGPPRPGCARVKELLEGVIVRSYKNRSDPVTDVPLTIEPVFDYCHPHELIEVSAAPPDDDPWGPLADHHSELYIKALTNA